VDDRRGGAGADSQSEHGDAGASGRNGHLGPLHGARRATEHGKVQFAMKVYGDVEHVNLHTGERWRRVTGDGESRLERVGCPDHIRLGPREETQEELVERAVCVARIIRQAAELLKEESNMPHYADGTPAKHGDIVLQKQSWNDVQNVLVVVSINSAGDTCNAGCVRIATQQGPSPWFPTPHADWTVTLKECMPITSPHFPEIKPST